MLAKQVWTLLQHPESLAYRILKANYFPRSELLQASVGYRPSYLWRSLIAAKELVKEGEAWRIGDGKTTQISDRWIGVEGQTSPMGDLQDDICRARVRVLIDGQSNTWNIEYLNRYFQEDDVRRIMAIPLSRNKMQDCRIWRFTPHGFFTVKSAYYVAVSKFSQIHNKRPSPSVIPLGWKKLWRIDVIPRVKMFLWRACSNALPTRVNLIRRGCMIEPRCPLCGEEDESVEHLLIKCQEVYSVWYGSKLRLDMRRETTTSFRELVWEKIDKFPAECMELFAYTAWEIWKRRNAVCFEKSIFDVHEVSRRAFMQWQLHTDERQIEIKMVPKKNAVERWKPPSIGAYKANSDVAVMEDGTLGLGYVVRDEHANVVLAGKTSMRAEGGSTLLEGYAMRYTLQMTKQYNILLESIESDNKNLVETVNGKQKPVVYCDILVGDINNLIRDVRCKRVEYVPRQNNQVAYQAARGGEFLSIRQNPVHLFQYLEADARK